MTVTVATLKGSEAKIGDESLEELRMTIRGDVLTPRDAGYALGPPGRTTRCIRGNRRWSYAPPAPPT